MNWAEINRRWVKPANDAWKSGDVPAAERLFREGLKATGGDGMVALAYGRLLEKVGRLEEARGQYATALERLPLAKYKGEARAGLERVSRAGDDRRSEDSVKEGTGKGSGMARDFKVRLYELARRFVKLAGGNDETARQIQAHREEHRMRCSTWQELVRRDGVEPDALLPALKDTDWHGSTRRFQTAENLCKDPKKVTRLMAILRRLSAHPPEDPEGLAAIIEDLPPKFGLGFLSEVGGYLRPDSIWEWNDPVQELLSSYGFDPKHELPWGRRSDVEAYFSAAPFFRAAREALASAGWEEASFLDVDLMFYEALRNRHLLPVPFSINAEELDKRIRLLRLRYPDMETFTAAEWIDEEREYKEELAERFRELLVEPGPLDAGEAAARTLQLLRVRLVRGEGPQNLIDWRSVNRYEESLKDPGIAERYGEAVLTVVHGDGPMETRVARASEAVVDAGGSRAFARMLPTLLAMLLDPANEIFIRTDEFRRAAKELVGEQILDNNKPLDERQYVLARRFAKTLYDALSSRHFQPRDLIDIQGFIYVTNRMKGKPRPAWILQANPEYDDLVEALKSGVQEEIWTIPEFREEIWDGDQVYFWVSGRERGIVATGRTTSNVIPFEELEPGEWERAKTFLRERSDRDGSAPAHVIRIRIERAFPENRIPAERLTADERLKDLPILKTPRGTVFKVPPELAERLNALIAEEDGGGSRDEAEAAGPSFRPMGLEAILDGLRRDGLHFPPDLVAEYVLALQTKRFVILTGISGTGKTRLAMAIANHFAAEKKVPAGEFVDDGAVTVTVRPYMRKYNRILLPRTLSEPVTWQITEGNRSYGRIRLAFPGGSHEVSFHQNPKTQGITVFLAHGVKEWFQRFIGENQALILRVTVDDEGVARELTIEEPKLDDRVERIKNYEVVAVRPDWTDHRGLLGYHNPLTGQYVVTPFLSLLLRASEDARIREREGGEPAPFFAILDEMNLARVEHYFSDLLSAMESGEKIHLHSDTAVEEGETDGEPVPKEIAVPPNLYVIGTVNVDETTYMFSPKVLDRAFTLELNEVDLEGYGVPDRMAANIALPDFAGLPGVWERPGQQEWDRLGDIGDGKYRQLLIDLNELLTSDRRHFGYRVANEMARFVRLAWEQSGRSQAATDAAFDMAVHAKVLPKLHGTQQELQNVLEALFGFAIDPSGAVEASWRDFRNWATSAGTLMPATAGSVIVLETGEEGADDAKPPEPYLPRTAAKVHRMLQRLERQGFTSFIE